MSIMSQLEGDSMTGYQSKKTAAEAKVFDREEAVDYLTESDFQYIVAGDASGLELLRTYLEDGFTGYANFNDQQLMAEVKERKWMETQ
jgi:hypothetical protein